MGKYNYENNLKILFQQLVLTPLDENLAKEVEMLLKYIIDSKDSVYFENPLTYNLLFLLKSKKLSFYLEHLIKEVELKLMRLAFDFCGETKEKNQNQECSNCNEEPFETILNPPYEGSLPNFPNMKKPPFGYTSTVQEELLIDGQRIVNFYTIDHEGKTISYDKKTIEKMTNSNVKHLNESILYEALKNNLNKK